MRFLSLIIITLLRPSPEQMAAAQRWCNLRSYQDYRDEADLEEAQAAGCSLEVWREARRRAILREVHAMRVAKEQKRWKKPA